MQEVLERAISAVTQEDVQIVGAGRTDAGAHAVDQVIAFATESLLAPHVLQRAINAHLPMDIAVTAVREVPLDFHPRYDAHSRTYRYTIWNRPVRSPLWMVHAAHVKPPLDERHINEALQYLVGRHDFSAFVAPAIVGSRERTMYRAECRRQGDLVIVELQASGFLRQMVRAIVGTLIEVGVGKMDSHDFQAILESGDRTRAGATAPARGLCLMQVHYADSADEHSRDRDEFPAVVG